MNRINPTNTQMRMTRMRMRMDDNFFVFVLIFLSITLSPINSNQLESIVVASDGLNDCKQLQYYYIQYYGIHHPSVICHSSSSVYYIILFSYILLNALCISTSANVSNLQYSNNAFLVAFVVSSSSSLSSSC